MGRIRTEKEVAEHNPCGCRPRQFPRSDKLAIHSGVGSTHFIWLLRVSDRTGSIPGWDYEYSRNGLIRRTSTRRKRLMWGRLHHIPQRTNGLESIHRQVPTRSYFCRSESLLGPRPPMLIIVGRPVVSSSKHPQPITFWQCLWIRPARMKVRAMNSLYSIRTSRFEEATESRPLSGFESEKKELPNGTEDKTTTCN